MAVPAHAYTDPTAGADTLIMPTAQPQVPTPLILWPPVANPVSHARPVGASLAATPIQAPSVVPAPWLNFMWTTASNAFFMIWGSVTRRGWQIYPSGRNR